jgi:hypothetical protein
MRKLSACDSPTAALEPCIHSGSPESFIHCIRVIVKANVGKPLKVVSLPRIIPFFSATRRDA